VEITHFTMAGFFKNHRLYLLATCAYMGSLLFGAEIQLSSLKSDMTMLMTQKVMIPVLWGQFWL
jgi:hypothetical protein